MLLHPRPRLSLTGNQHRHGLPLCRNLPFHAHLERVGDGRLTHLRHTDGHLDLVPEPQESPKVHADMHARNSGDDLVEDSQPMHEHVFGLFDQP
jgi:hypothetical protein